MYPSYTNPGVFFCKPLKLLQWTVPDGIQRKYLYSTQSANPPRLRIPSTIHKPELFFSNASPMTAHPASPPVPQRPHHSYSAPPPRQFPSTSLPSPRLQRSNSNPPPIPPKPLSPPVLPPKLPLATYPVKKQRERLHLEELQTAIEMSKLESDKQATLSSQEANELARALEESVRLADITNSYSSALSEGSPTIYSTQAGPSSGNTPPSSTKDGEEKLCISPDPLTAKTSSIHSNEDVIKLQMSQMSDDEALARQLAAEEAEEERIHEETVLKASVIQPPQPVLPLYPSKDHGISPLTPSKHDGNDEAFARRLAAEEEEEIMAEEAAAATAPKVSVPVPIPSNEPAVPPPTYSDVISPPSSSKLAHTTPISPSSLSDVDCITSPSSISSYTTSSDSLNANQMPDTSTQTPLPSVPESVRESDEQPVPPPPMNNNPHIDQSLLRGVCAYSQFLLAELNIM